MENVMVPLRRHLAANPEFGLDFAAMAAIPGRVVAVRNLDAAGKRMGARGENASSGRRIAPASGALTSEREICRTRIQMASLDARRMAR